jgi:hypothetical protein
MIPISPARARRFLSPILSATRMLQRASNGWEAHDRFIGVTFAVAGIFGAGRLAGKLKELESVDLIGPWHVGH